MLNLLAILHYVIKLDFEATEKRSLTNDHGCMKKSDESDPCVYNIQTNEQYTNKCMYNIQTL